MFAKQNTIWMTKSKTTGSMYQITCIFNTGYKLIILDSILKRNYGETYYYVLFMVSIGNRGFSQQ